MKNNNVINGRPKITIESEVATEFTEKRSRFIATTSPVKNEEEAKTFIDRIKSKYSDATHNVFAYYIDNGTYARYSDDGEPQGTAGLPVLNVLKMSGLSDICTVVTRYFGGILLGAGGLVRAYSSAAKKSLDACVTVVYKDYSVLGGTLSYSEYQKLLKVIEAKGIGVDKAEFGETVSVIISALSENEKSVFDLFRDLTLGKSDLEVLKHEERPCPTELM